MKGDKVLINFNAFQNILENSNRKPNKKVWVNNVGEFYNRLVKPWLQVKNIELYSTHNERKSFVSEIFIRTLKNKIYKYMTLISKNVYTDKLDDIVNKYNNTYHRAIKIKPVDVKSKRIEIWSWWSCKKINI